MTSEWKPESEEAEERQAIVRSVGRPAEPDRPGEEAGWRRFLKWACPWLKHKAELADRYAEAEVNDREAKADITVQQAAEHSAEAEAKRLANVAVFFDLVDRTLPPDGDAAGDLKLAKLIEASPGVADQMGKMRQMREMLRLKYGATVEVGDPEPAATPPAPTPDPARLPLLGNIAS